MAAFERGQPEPAQRRLIRVVVRGDGKQLLAHAFVPEEILRLLREKGDFAPSLQCAVLRVADAGDQLQQRRFAAAVCAEQTEQVAPVRRQRQIAQHVRRVFFIAERHFVQFQRGVAFDGRGFSRRG